MVQVLRVESIELKHHPSLSRVCHQVKNLYNRANYLIKDALKNEGKNLYYYDLNSLLKHEECYRILPAQTAQQSLKLLNRNWKAYFTAMKEWKKTLHSFLQFLVLQTTKQKMGKSLRSSQINKLGSSMDG